MNLHGIQKKEKIVISKIWQRWNSSTQKKENNTPQDCISRYDGYIWGRWQYLKNDEEKEAEIPDDTSTVDMEEGVNDRNDDNNEKYDEDKDKECPDDTSPIEVEEGVSDINDDKNE